MDTGMIGLECGEPLPRGLASEIKQVLRTTFDGRLTGAGRRIP